VKKKRKITLLIIALIVVSTAIVGFVVVRSIESNLEELTNIAFGDIDLDEIADGSYFGSFSTFPVVAEVEVVVRNHEIVEIIILKHTHGRGSDAEVVPDRVVSSQSLKVDAVSGATFSSLVILKAIEDALADYL
jgi:uncharacterized protein with FMN-binding domain